MSKISFAVISVLFFLLQSSVFPFLLRNVTGPDLWLCASVLSIIIYDKKTALSFAVIGGALADIVTGNFFGLHLFPYIVTTLLISFFIREKYHRRIFVSLYFTCIASCLYILALWGVIWFSGARVDILDYLMHRAGEIVGMNVLAAAFIHHLLWSIKKEWVSKW